MLMGVRSYRLEDFGLASRPRKALSSFVGVVDRTIIVGSGCATGTLEGLLEPAHRL